MKLRLLAALGALFTMATIAACASSERDTSISPTTPGPDASAGETAEEEEEDVTKQPPHSLGTIVLGEMHGSGADVRVTPVVLASFLPDARLGKSCTKKVGGCEIAKVAKCSDTSGVTGCSSGEVCTFDDSCDAVCKRIPTCTEACGADEVCKASSSSSSKGKCVKIESFDAGPLAFSGTTTAITMYPPYKFESDAQGAPFLGGASITVQAQGAVDAGFEAFEEKFTATTFLQTREPLSSIPKDKVFGKGSIPIEWVPGDDAIVVTVTGSAGTATCKVKDSLGKFDLPRSVVDAVQDPDAGTSSLSLAVSRQKKEVRKDKKAKGELTLATVEPEGWLELVTLSTETASFAGCSGTQEYCEDTCTDVSSDRYNCGGCGITCTSSQTCSEGKCVTGSTGSTCSSCRNSALANGCSTYHSTCEADFDCSDYSYCFRSCTTASCQATCQSSYPAGYSKFSSLRSCLSDYCYSSCPGLN